MNQLAAIARYIDCVTEWIGKILAWCILAMVILMFINVVERYAFNISATWQQELVRFFHSIVFLGAAGYTLLWDKHVRVDVFYHKFSERKKAWVNLIGTILFMVPVCAGIIYLSYYFVIDSWALHEASSEYNGMKGIFILKTFIWLFAATLLLQSVSVCCKAVMTIKGSNHG